VALGEPLLFTSVEGGQSGAVDHEPDRRCDTATDGYVERTAQRVPVDRTDRRVSGTMQDG